MNIGLRPLLLVAFAQASASLSGCVVHERTIASPARTSSVSSPAPAAHPAYLHALSDLRNARYDLLRRGGDAEVRWDERDATGAIDHAIAEIKEAAIDDGKDLTDHPAVDARETRSGRLHRALAVLRAAREDIAREEDNEFARGLRGRAIHHIDEAIRHTELGIAAAERGI